MALATDTDTPARKSGAALSLVLDGLRRLFIAATDFDGGTSDCAQDDDTDALIDRIRNGYLDEESGRFITLPRHVQFELIRLLRSGR